MIKNQIPVKNFNPVLTGFVDGKCPTDICGASCCQNDAWTGEPGPCSQLDDEKLCKLQQGVYGNVMKPYFCAIWPTSQADIDNFNANGGNCQLRYK